MRDKLKIFKEFHDWEDLSMPEIIQLELFLAFLLVL